MGENLDEMDQLIFKQYMEDLDAEHAHEMANGVSDMDRFQNQPEPGQGVRKAESHKYGQLLGGDDDEEVEDQSYSHP